jgi:hypothetical protein
VTETASNEYKRCPFCDEEIRVKAVICKHCHQWMPGYTYDIEEIVLPNGRTYQPG